MLVRNLPGRGKRAVEAVECVIEPDLLYPLLRWGDVARYRARPRAWLILAQDVQSRKGIDEAVMRERYPRTLAYLTRFRDVLTARAAYRRYQHGAAFYSMYNVGPYTPAPIKVVWRRMDTRINAAVVEPIDDPMLGTRPVIAQETCVQLEAGSLAEAHYLAAVLNSSGGEPAGRLAQRSRRQGVRHAGHARLHQPAAFRPGKPRPRRVGRSRRGRPSSRPPRART